MQKIKLKQESQNEKIVYMRYLNMLDVRDKLIDKLLNMVNIVPNEDGYEVTYNDYDITKVIVEGTAKLYLLDMEITQDRLYKTAYEVHSDVSKAIKAKDNILDDVILSDIVNTKVKDKLWSDRIWKHKLKLTQDIKDIITDRVIGEHDNLEYKAKEISRRFDVDLYSAKRLLYNETARVENAVKLETFKKSGMVTQVKRETMKDDRVSELCASEDGDIWDIDDPNMPTLPRHIGCRCIYVPYYKKADKYK